MASPSLSDGLSLPDQTLLRAETADFISQMGQQCKITQWAIATGSVYLHVFFTRFSFARFDRFEVAATCLFLAGKVEERRTRVDQVINAYYHVRLNPPAFSSSSSSSSTGATIQLLPPSPSSPEYDALRQRIYTLEFAVLDAIEFVFEVSHPYPNLMTYLRETIYGPKYANKRTHATRTRTRTHTAPRIPLSLRANLHGICVWRSRELHLEGDERERRVGADRMAVHQRQVRTTHTPRLLHRGLCGHALPQLSLTPLCCRSGSMSLVFPSLVPSGPAEPASVCLVLLTVGLVCGRLCAWSILPTSSAWE